MHKLIQDGAKCVHSANDVLEDFNKAQVIDRPQLFHSYDITETPKNNSLNKEELLIYDLLDFTPINIEDILTQSSLSIHKILPVLSMLEIKGLIAQHPGKNYSKK